MKREIKFRGLRADGKGWVYGFYYEYNGKSIISSEYHSDDADTYYNDEVAPESVGQYTGLKDKKGVDIYEGDIIPMNIGVQRYANWNVGDVSASLNGTMKWNKYQMCWEITFKQPNKYNVISSSFGWSISPQLEVIGNIHEP